MGVFRLGFLTRYLSDPLISGFTVGASFVVFTSQVKYIFGLKVPRQSGIFAVPKVSKICSLQSKSLSMKHASSEIEK